jgi:DMSO reductase anchor subunit
MREQPMVPAPEFDSYYGRPILKRPVWKQPDVPLYFFLGGVAGASAVLAEGAAASDRPGLQRVARSLAFGGAGLGTVALIHDLGRPERFLNMLRVFKPTSPLSVGSWLLAPFTGLSSVALASDVTGRLPVLGRLAGLGAAALGPGVASYTAALIADTAIPAWHEGYREMPFVFAGSAGAAAGGLSMVLAPRREAGPARRLAALGATVELAATGLMQRRLGELARPYEEGRPGVLLRTAKVLTVAGGVGTLVAGRSKLVSVASGLSFAGASVLTRFGVFQAGLASADDPAYVVRPQRERLARREAGDRTLAG